MKHFHLLCFLMLTAVPLPAQTLEECRRLAREHYPEIRQYDLVSQTEQYNLSNAAKAWIPQVTLSGQASYQTAAAEYPDAFNAMMQANGIKMEGIRKEQYKIAVDVSQQIWDGGKSKSEKRTVEAKAAEQRTMTDVSLYGVQSRVDNIYFGIILLDERKTQTENLIKLLESNLSRMKAYHKNGVATQADVDMVEAELLTAKQTLEQIKYSHASYCRMLELFIGKPLSGGKLERPAMQDIAEGTSARPELELFNAQENTLNVQKEEVKSSLMPRFSAFAQGYYGYPGLDMFKSMTSSRWRLNAIIGLRMSWNIGVFYTRKNNLKKIDAAQQQIAVKRDIFLFNNEMQRVQDEGEIKRLRKAVEDDSRIAELRQKIRIAAESQFANGVIDATELLRRITDETAALINRSTHEIELLQAIYKLKTTLNR